MKCSRKTAYNTEAYALKRGWAWHQTAYKCPECGKWHLTKARQGPGDEERERRAVDVGRAQDLASHDAKHMIRRMKIQKGRKR